MRTRLGAFKSIPRTPRQKYELHSPEILEAFSTDEYLERIGVSRFHKECQTPGYKLRIDRLTCVTSGGKESGMLGCSLTFGREKCEGLTIMLIV